MIFILHVLYEGKWRPPNLSELTPIIFNIMELTHFGSKSFKLTKSIDFFIYAFITSKLGNITKNRIVAW